jgi:uncharacterized protein
MACINSSVSSSRVVSVVRIWLSSYEWTVWAAFELEGLGCNLQHYNFNPDFTKEVLETWNLPTSWILKSQLVFGTPQDGLKRRAERTYLPLEDRVKVFAS